MTCRNHHLRTRLIAAAAACSLIGAACGGGDEGSDDTADVPVVIDDDVVDGGALDDLDEDQLEILNDAFDDLGDDADGGAPAPWDGIRLLTAGGSAFLETINTENFSGVERQFQTPIDDPQPIVARSDRLIALSVVAGDALWVNGTRTLHRVALTDGAITASVSIDDVLPGGEFADITGDDAGVYAVAAVTSGSDAVVEVDPVTGEVRSITDLSNEVTSLLTIASNATHVAVAYESAPGVPVVLIERATGATTEIGNYLQLHEVHFVRDELWVVIASSKVTEPATYERYAVDGTPLGEGALPQVGELRVFGDRAVVMIPSNATDPDVPVSPIEVEPVGTPIEDILPPTMVRLSGYAEIDGYAIASGECCLKDADGFSTSTAVIDLSTGEVVDLADGVPATAVLPAG